MSKKPGRQAKGARHPQTVRFPVDMYDSIKEAALAEGLDIGTWVIKRLGEVEGLDLPAWVMDDVARARIRQSPIGRGDEELDLMVS